MSLSQAPGPSGGDSGRQPPGSLGGKTSFFPPRIWGLGSRWLENPKGECQGTAPADPGEGGREGLPRGWPLPQSV